MTNVVCVVLFCCSGGDVSYHKGITISHARMKLITTQIEVQNTQARFVRGKKMRSVPLVPATQERSTV